MARLDDISDLLTPKTDPGFGFRQATVISFDSATGSCSVNLNGGILTNLPILSESSGVQLAPGDVVVLMKLKSSFAVLGKVYSAGDPKLFVGAQFGAADTGNGGAFPIPIAAGTNFATVTFAPPVWANAATVIATTVAGGVNSSGATGQLNTGANISGGTGLTGFTGLGGFPGASVPNGAVGQVTAAGAGLISFSQNSVPLVISASVWTNGAVWASSAANYVTCVAQLIFQKR